MAFVETVYVDPNGQLTLEDVGTGDFFRIPGEATVYKVMIMPSPIDKETALILNLDDLQLESLELVQQIEPVEINRIDMKVEIL